MSSFLFDCRLTASIRVEADSETEAREKLEELLDCADANFGAIDGDPVTAEVSLCESDPRLLLAEGAAE